jgi:hypothetical protein
MKHIKGEWTHQFSAGNHHGIVYDEKTGETIAVIYPLNERIHALIASAPDLLEACQSARFIVNSDPTLHHLKNEPWWKKLNNAIAKVMNLTVDDIENS